jgi:hypothetical protein
LKQPVNAVVSHLFGRARLAMRTTRRSFVGAAGAVSAWMLSSFDSRRALANAQAPAQGAPDAGSPADGGTRPDAGSTEQVPAGIAQAARERYGKFLDDKQLKLLDAKLADIETRSKRLHAFKLTNSDEPPCDFHAVRP